MISDTSLVSPIKKKHPEKIFRIHDNLLPSKMDAYGIWSAMQLHLGQYRKLKNSVITIRISPSRENTKHFNEDDWLKLWQDFVTEFDKPRMTDKNGKGVSVQTNIANSIHTVWLHHDAEGGVYHLHADVCRRDINGKTNDDSMIHDVHRRLLNEWLSAVAGLRLLRFTI